MPGRVAVHRIIVGHGADRKVIKAGSAFQSEDYGIDAKTLKRYEDNGIVRKPRDQTVRAPVDTGPREPVAEERLVIEDREPSGEEVEREPVGDEDEKPARGRRRSRDSIDL